MPLFGKKKQESEKTKSTPGSYPTQRPASATFQTPQGFSQPQGAPPPYTPQATTYQQPGFPPQPQSFPPPGQQYATQFGVAPGPSTTVVVQGGFDAGARFDVAGANIPPPPPGCLPNASQVAMAQGHNVVVTQKPGDFVTGGSDGGMVIW